MQDINQHSAETENQVQSKPKNKTLQALRNILFLAIGIGIIYMIVSKQNFEEIWTALKQANLWWCLHVFVCSLIGSVFRTLRWKLILEPMGYNPSFANLFNPLMFGYMVNLGVPRLGEFTRCISLKKKEDIPVSSSFGTVMVERLVDMIFLVITTAIAFYLEYDRISTFFKENIFKPLWGIVQKNILDKPIVLAIIVGLIGYFFYWIYKNSGDGNPNSSEPETKLDTMTNEVWAGLMSVFKIKKVPQFAFYSVMIWLMYCLNSIFWLYAFKETAVLGIGVGFVMFVVGTMGRSVPIQGGGMGAYHYLVSEALLLFGIANPIGFAYAILNHGSSVIYNIIMGIYAWIALLITKDKSEEYF